MFNTKKTVRQDIHENEVAYSGTVTAVTHMTIVVFIPALDVEVDVKRNPDASVQNGSVPEVGDIATVQVVLEEGDYNATAATFVPQQDIKEDIPSPMTTSLMTIWMMKKQRSMTGTTSLLQMILAIGTLTELLRLALSNSRSVV